MKVLITAQKHRHYDRTGEIVGKLGDKWKVRIPNRDGSLFTYVREGEWKPTKRQ